MPCAGQLREMSRGDCGTHGRVGAPDVNIGIGHCLARLVVDDLDGQRQGDALLATSNVLPDLLSLHVCLQVSILLVLTTSQTYTAGPGRQPASACRRRNPRTACSDPSPWRPSCCSCGQCGTPRCSRAGGALSCRLKSVQRQQVHQVGGLLTWPGSPQPRGPATA
jgi:hypothetical protein